MNAIRKLTTISLFLAVVTLGSQGWAATVNLSLMAAKEAPGANGTAVLSESSLSVQAKGLKPNAVYTVWFVNMKPAKEEAGAGKAPYMFKTDAAGNGRYESAISGSQFGKWAMIMIVRHPTGDPMDTKNMVPALSAEIPKGK